MKVVPSIDTYKIEVEILSPTCTGGVDNISGNEDVKYNSYEYFICDDRVYFVSENDIMNLLNQGMLNDKDLDLEYEDLINKIMKNEKARNFLKSAKLSRKLENKIEFKRFAKSVIIEENGIREVPTIFGSTIKGILRTGFVAYRAIDVKYDFERKGKNLKLNSLSINNNKISKDKSIFSAVFKKDEYDINIDVNNLDADKVVNLIFKNIICSDLRLYEGNMVVEKISKIHRKSNSGIPQYFETPEVGSKFLGEIKYKYKDGKNTLLSLFSCLSKSQDAINPVEEAFIGLKKLGINILEVEKKIMSSIVGDKLDGFYNTLIKANEDENQFVFKLGFSGILSKTFMALDKYNLNNDEFLPYTINVVEDTKIPTGWVKIRWEIE